MNPTFLIVGLLLLAGFAVVIFLKQNKTLPSKVAGSVVTNPNLRDGKPLLIDPRLPNGSGEIVSVERQTEDKATFVLQTPDGIRKFDYYNYEIDASAFLFSNLAGSGKQKYMWRGVISEANKMLLKKLESLKIEKDMEKGKRESAESNIHMFTDKVLEHVAIVEGAKGGDNFGSSKKF